MRRARLAVAACFFANGAVVGGWAPQIPGRALALGLNPGRLGTILFAGGAGALLGMASASWLIARFGTRAVAYSAGMLFCASLTTSVTAPHAWLLAASLALLGFCGATMDVAMNSQAILVEGHLQRRSMSLFHGLFSLGGVVGSAVTSAALDRHFAPSAIAGAITLTLFLLLLLLGRGMLPREFELRDGPGHAGRVFKPRLVLLGLLTFAAMVNEGGIMDWSAMFLRTVRHLSVGLAGYGFSAFSTGMVLGRLTGDRIIGRLGDKNGLRLGGLLAALALMAVLLGHGPVVSIAAFGLAGLGLANASPILYRAAGKVPGVPSSVGIATAVGIGYAAFLVGPPMLGWVGQWQGLGASFAVLAGLCCVVAAGAVIANQPSQPRVAELR